MRRLRTVLFLADRCVHALAFQATGRSGVQRAHTHTEFRRFDSLFGDVDVESLADAIVDAATRSEFVSSSASLVIPVNWVFTQVLDDLPRRHTEELLRYELEPHLPVSIESLTCTFLPLDGTSRLAVAIPTEPVRQLLNALSERNISIEGMYVDALMAARSRGQVRIIDELWIRSARLASNPIESCVSVATTASSRHEEGLNLADDEGQGGLAFDLRAEIEIDATNYDAPAPDGGLLHLTEYALAATAELNLLVGDLAPVSRGEVFSRSVRQCLVAACLLLLTVGAGLQFRTGYLDRELAKVREAQRQAYASVFESETLPPGGAMRLASERLRVTATTGDVILPAEMKDAGAPLVILRNWVAALPEDARVNLSEVRVDDRQLLLRGRTREHREAERLAEAVGRVPGLKHRAPRTRRDREGGVEFALVAEVIDEP